MSKQELKKIAEEIRIIKSELGKVSGRGLGDYPGSASDKVSAELYDNAKRKVVKKIRGMSIKDLLDQDALLTQAYEANEDGLFHAMIECKDQGGDPDIFECEEAEMLQKRYKNLLKKLERQSLLRHYLSGGSAMIEITFEDKDKNVYRILEGDIEIY